MDKCTQLEELDSLKSIYYSEEFQVLENSNQDDSIQAIFWAFFTLPDNYEVKFLESVDSPEPSCLKVKYLPPIELRLTLPKDYPSKAPPKFIISCKWLLRSNIAILCEKLDNIWLECGPAEILYLWCEFLKNDSLAYLGCDKQLDLTYLCLKHLTFVKKLQKNKERREMWRERKGLEAKENKLQLMTAETSDNPKGAESVENGTASPEPAASVKGVRENHNRNQQKYSYWRTNWKRKNKNSNLKKGWKKFDERAVLNLSLKTSPLKILENYNTERERVEFLRNFYTCNICFSDKLGKDCTQFKECKHVFCINCIKSYFTIRIKDGAVQSITCPEEKCTAEALPSQVKEIVSEELFAKYDSVLLTTALDTLSDIIYCPRRICQYPVSWEPEERMASCPNCQYVFCVICKMVYHGIEPCQYKEGEMQKVAELYENGTEEERQQMELRYGKKHLESLVDNSKAEVWIKENSKPCPKCKAAIEKSQGCNKMVCWKCKTAFCWLCCEILNSKDPYSHFRDPKSLCVNKLFHLVYNVGDDEDDDDDYDDDDEDDWDWVDGSDEDLFEPEDICFDWEEDYLGMLEDELYYM